MRAKVTELLEGILLVVMGIACVKESVRLTIHMREQFRYDFLGPDHYILGVGSSLLIIGIVYLFTQLRQKPSVRESTVEKSKKWGGMVRAAGLIGVLALYALLAGQFGYLLSSPIFFLLAFKICGVRSWFFSVILGVACAIAFQLLFIHFLGVIFPRGSIIDLADLGF